MSMCISTAALLGCVSAPWGGSCDMSMCRLRRPTPDGCPFEKILWRSWWSSLSEVIAWSCTAPYAKILWRSGWNPLLSRSFWEDLVDILPISSKSSLHDLAHVPVRRSCGDPADNAVLHDLLLEVKFSGCPCMTCTSPSENFWWRSCSRGFALRSWRCSAWSCTGPYQKILSNSCENPPWEALHFDLEEALHDPVQSFAVLN